MANLPQTLALEIRKTLRKPDADNVHDLRVAIRRLSQALALDPASKHDRLLHKFKATMRLAGEVRNADITLKLVAKLKRTKTLQARLRRRRNRAEARLMKALRQWTVRKLPRQLPQVSRPPGHPVVRAARRLFKRAAKAGDPQGLHRTRIAAKKLRYTLELVAPHHPRLEAIKQVQTDLGRINDYETAWTIVKEESGRKSISEQLKRTQAGRIREFHRSWARLFPDAATRRAWMREFAAIHPRNVSRAK